jgi:hypothetical protein
MPQSEKECFTDIKIGLVKTMFFIPAKPAGGFLQ